MARELALSAVLRQVIAEEGCGVTTNYSS